MEKINEFFRIVQALFPKIFEKFSEKLAEQAYGFFYYTLMRLTIFYI